MSEVGNGSRGALSLEQQVSVNKRNGEDLLRNVSFLIVEDNSFSSAICRNMLQSFGAREILLAKDGSDALETLRASEVDIVILDWEMPEMDGIEFARYIRKDPNSPNIFLPIIMMTSYSELSHVLYARDAGVNEYLIKPCSVQQLMARIKALVENPRPYVKIGDYFGPDRRRRKKDEFAGDDRRDGAPGKVLDLNKTALQQTEVDNLFGGESEDVKK